jgi:hypothetical protein
MNDIYKSNFLRAASEWICDAYALTIRYIVFKNDVGQRWLADASIDVNPLPHLQNLRFEIEQAGISAGQIELNWQSRQQVLGILDLATRGTIDVHGEPCSLCLESDLYFHSEMATQDRWFSDLNLQVVGERPKSPINIDFVAIDNQLRRSNPPFDGLADVTAWLNLTTPRSTDVQPSIKIRVGPPVDIIIEQCSLTNNELTLVLHAHAELDISGIGLAVRSVPGNGLAGRKQAASQIKWNTEIAGRKEGIVHITVEEADSSLVILMLGNETIRRQWFLDPGKARNSRLVATQLFDNELRRLQKVIFDNNDSREFEKGIASLAFLLGFSSAQQIESDAPDLIVTTPSGRVALVECTLKTADFTSKLGKLVDRRQALSKAFESNRHHAQIYAILICALPRDQIKHDPAELSEHSVALVTKEDLSTAFNQLRHPVVPDKMFDALDNRFAAAKLAF